MDVGYKDYSQTDKHIFVFMVAVVLGQLDVRALSAVHHYVGVIGPLHQNARNVAIFRRLH